MVHFVGAGPGAPDLITVRGQHLLREADVIIYAGSLVNPALLDGIKESCVVYDSSRMHLQEIVDVMTEAEDAKLVTVRLHTGDPSLFGAVREQMDALEERGIAYDSTPGVSAFCAAAAALNLEYTLPEVSQSVILTRMEGRTAVPKRESISSFAAHGATMVLFLSSAMAGKLSQELIAGGYSADTPAAIVYRASWPDEKCLLCTVGTLERTAQENAVTRQALILVGQSVAQSGYAHSKLYDASFETGYRPERSDGPQHQQQFPDALEGKGKLHQ